MCLSLIVKSCGGGISRAPVKIFSVETLPAESESAGLEPSPSSRDGVRATECDGLTWVCNFTSDPVSVETDGLSVNLWRVQVGEAEVLPEEFIAEASMRDGA